MAVSVEDRPKFAAAWANSLRIYKHGSSHEERLQHIAMTIGGRVFSNICKEFSGKECTIPTQQERDTNREFARKWENTCAVRMSYILNYTGSLIPRQPQNKTVSGSDGFQYFYRVNDVIEYLKNLWGQPDVVVANPFAYVEARDAEGNIIRNPDGSAKFSDYGGHLAGRQGVILFEVPERWGDALGHASLFNGRECYDHCYFNEAGVHSGTTKANFWSLP